MQDFHNLKVWQKAHGVVLEVYKATKPFPKDELFGLTSQIRRAAVSIPANIAEGAARGSDPDFGRFLSISLGSASELEYHLLLGRDLGYLNETLHRELENKLVEVKRMLGALIKTLKKS